MKRLLLLALLLAPLQAVPYSSWLEFRLDFDLEGGSGHIDLLEFPRNFSRQRAYCTGTRMEFPPDPSFSCTVERYTARDLSPEGLGVTGLTETTGGMGRLARELSAGREGEFGEAVALAGWVRRHVEYDLGTGGDQHSAEWTYRNRIGTCDELSHLFVALAHAAGLQPRYVTGYVYDGTKWLPHAWAEVWTEYGWVPVDVAFDQYGYVDASHVATYKGPDGNHSFMTYPRGTGVDYSYDLKFTSYTNDSFIVSASVTNATGNASALARLQVRNPFQTPVAFFPRLTPPEGFDVELLWPRDGVVLPPGFSEVRVVLGVQPVGRGYVYKVPISLQLGPDYVPLTFTVSGGADCPPLPEVQPYTYDVSGCVDLSTGNGATGAATGGAFFCDGCFHRLEEPSSRKYELNYPEFCLENCTLVVGVVGKGPYRIEANGLVAEGDVDVYEEVRLPLEVGNNTVVVDGVERTIGVRSPPEPQLSWEVKDGRVCFSSNWQLDSQCHPLACGNGTISLGASYGGVSRTLVREVRRDCSLWERLLQLLRGLMG